MNILITNDDGIMSEGIRILADAAAEFGTVTVAAPKNQCSGMSQRISIPDNNGTLEFEEYPFGGPVKRAWRIDGTPADCVAAALKYLLDEKPDYVFSGINDGYNTGFDIAYSGTVGATMEAVMNGIPAAAFSVGRYAETTVLRKELPSIIGEILASEPLKGEIWNVNFPDCEPSAYRGVRRGTKIAPLSFYGVYYEMDGSGGRQLLIPKCRIASPTDVPTDSDIYSVLNGCTSIGRVSCNVIQTI